MRALSCRKPAHVRAVAAAALLAALASGCGRAQVDQLLLRGSSDLGDGGVVGDLGPITFDGAISFDSGTIIDGSTIDRDVGVAGECTSVPDCFAIHGRPPACPNEQASWSCVEGACVATCGPVACENDCDCDPRSACLGGQCMVANRNNLCCSNPFCPPGQSCQLPTGGESTCPTTPPVPDAGVRDAGMRRDAGPMDAGPPSTGAVGSECSSTTASCSAGPSPFCIDETNGFPGGYCTSSCGQGIGRCPQGASCRQIGPNTMGSVCLDLCTSNADCRASYACVRAGTSQDRVCLPVATGSTNPMGNAVGGECTGDQDCGPGLVCLSDASFPGGYCSKLFCDDQNNPCPANGACTQTPVGVPLCLAICGGTPDCREGYRCLQIPGQAGVCVIQN